MRQVGVLVREPLERLGHPALADQQVLVVGRRGVLLRRHRDAQQQPHAHQFEQHRQLVLAQRRHLVVAAHERHDRARRVRLTLHRVRARDREPAHARGPDDVAEVDQPGDRPVLGDQHVVLVGVVVDDLVGEVIEGRHGDPDLARMAQVPAMGAAHGRVLEVRERLVHARDGAAEARHVAARIRPRAAVEPGQQPHGPVRRARRSHPARRGTAGSSRRCSSTASSSARSGARRVQLQHEALAAGLEAEVEIVLAGQGRRAALESVQVARDPLGGIRAHDADLGRGENSAAGPMKGMDPLDTLATDLRERLLAGAGADERRPSRADPRAGRSRGRGAERGPPRRPRRADRGARLRARAAGAAARRPVGGRDHGLRHRAGVDRAARAAGADRRALRARGGPARRDRADPRAARPARRRGRAAVRRAPARRLARERRAAAARAGRPGADDPALPPARVLRRGPRRATAR